MLSGSQLAAGLGQIPYLLASVLLQPALKRHHQVDPAKAEEASNIRVLVIKISVKFFYRGYVNQKGQSVQQQHLTLILAVFRFFNGIFSNFETIM